MRPSRVVSASFVLSMLASAGLVVVYLLGGEPQAEGVLLGIALGGLGLGVSLWAVKLLPSQPEVEDREELASAPAEVAGAEDTLDDDALTRRGALLKLLGAAGAALGGALAIPALSLGPRPGQSLFRTQWTPGARVVDADGEPVRPADLVLGSVTTVYPEGFEGAADAQTLLIKLDVDRLEMPPERVVWAPEGCIGYSKICTHAGCPVGLYRAEAHELLCPCHQSTFDVLRGCEVTFGPADRPLPQLPMGLDDEGYLVALDDFPEPVGPGFWNMTSGGDGS